MTISAITELTKRRAILERRLARAEAVQALLAADIAQIDAAIRQMEAVKAQAKLEAPAKPRDKLTRFLLDALRVAPEPLTLRHLALATMERRGLDATDAKAVAFMIEQVRAALRRQRRKGVVRDFVVDGTTARWALC
jgi:hypothetical protein